MRGIAASAVGLAQGIRASRARRLLLADAVEKLCSGDTQNLHGVAREHRRKMGDAEIGVQVAGDNRSHATAALITNFCLE
jgi:hypothetical protein